MSFAMAIDIAAFRPVDEFKEMMDEMIRALHESPTEPGAERVMVAGDPEEEAMKDRLANGVPILQARYDEIIGIARRVGAEVVI